MCQRGTVLFSKARAACSQTLCHWVCSCIVGSTCTANGKKSNGSYEGRKTTKGLARVNRLRAAMMMPMWSTSMAVGVVTVGEANGIALDTVRSPGPVWSCRFLVFFLDFRLSCSPMVHDVRCTFCLSREVASAVCVWVVALVLFFPLLCILGVCWLPVKGGLDRTICLTSHVFLFIEDLPHRCFSQVNDVYSEEIVV